MPDVKFKFIGDDSELRKKLANLAKMQADISNNFKSTLSKGGTNAVSEAIKQVGKDAIAAIKKLREERSKEISELNFLKQVEAEHKGILADKKSVTESLIQEEKQLSVEYKKGQLSLQEYNKSLKEAAEERRKANEEERKAEKVLRNSEKARKDADREEAKRQKDLEKRKKLLEQESSEYYKLNKALGAVRKEAKEVLAEMFRMERQGHKNTAGYEALRKKSEGLVAQTQLLDRGIKKIDATLGLHQRNVGNYTEAFEVISPQIANINQHLQLFGTSLYDLATKPGAIKEIGTAFLSIGKGIVSFLLSPIGALIAILGSLVYLFIKNKQAVIDFNNGLLNVAKTTGLEGRALQNLSDDIINLSRSLKTVSAVKLLEYASVAGQLGVKGSQNILAFSEALAKLETASDISGEEGASQIARLLQLVDGGVENIKAFGDEIVNLGNNFPATESEILANATRIAQSTGIYKLGRQEILAYATATKSVGVEAELVGSSLGRTLGVLEKSIRSGKGVAEILKLVGGTQAELGQRFREDASGVLFDFIGGLNRTSKTASDFNKSLEEVGITAQRDRDVIGSLASKGYAVLADSMAQVKDSTRAMNDEFTTASQKLVNQTARIGIAWDNMILGIENGQGFIGKASVSVIGFIADTIDTMSRSVTETDRLVSSYERFESQTNKLDRALKPLLERYDELKSKSNLNKVEHEELKSTIQRLADLIPTAVTGFNEYGEAIDINKGKIISFNNAQKQLLKDMNLSTVKSLNTDLDELKRQKDQLVKMQNTSVNGGKETFLSKFFSIGLTQNDKADGLVNRTIRLAKTTDKILQNLRKTKSLGGVLSPQDEKFLERYDGIEVANEKTNDTSTTDQIKKNKAYWEGIVDETQAAIDNLEIGQKGTKTWTDLTKKLAEAQQQVDKYSLSKDASASKSAGKIFEEQRKTVERQRSLQSSIDEINTNASRKMMRRDEEEVESVKDKYVKIKEEVRKFNENPKNKGLRVDTSALLASEKFEVGEAETKTGTKKLVESLNDQKKILDEYNAFASQTSKEEADKRYGNQLASFQDYKERLRKEYMDIIALQTTAESAAFTGSTVKLTQAQEDRAKILKELIASFDKEERDKENAKYAEALKLSETLKDKLFDIDKKYQDAYEQLEKNKTSFTLEEYDKRKEALRKGRLQESGDIFLPDLQKTDDWIRVFENSSETAVSTVKKSVSDLRASLTQMLSKGKITIDQYNDAIKGIKSVEIQVSVSQSGFEKLKQILKQLKEVEKGSQKSFELKQELGGEISKIGGSIIEADSALSGVFDKLGVGSDKFREDMALSLDLASNAVNLAQSIASGDVMGIITNGIKTLSSAISLFTKDRGIERKIQDYQRQIEALGKSYETLQKKMNGNDTNYYANSDQLISNLKEQKRLLEESAIAEEKKKKTDKEKAKGYRDGAEAVEKQIEDTENAIRQMRPTNRH
ncbi:phage tail tape measure protein [Sphingobacterium faecium]|uniref:phage tail tape measure protein n=1 Tax=Sphingobacterium faecium TaxID=34087 RepID=UPI00320A21EF